MGTSQHWQFILGELDQSTFQPPVGGGFHGLHEPLADETCRFVKTDMGNEGARFFDLGEAFHDVDPSIKAVLGIVSSVEREMLPFSAIVFHIAD